MGGGPVCCPGDDLPTVEPPSPSGGVPAVLTPGPAVEPGGAVEALKGGGGPGGGTP